MDFSCLAGGLKEALARPRAPFPQTRPQLPAHSLTWLQLTLLLEAEVFRVSATMVKDCLG